MQDEQTQSATSAAAERPSLRQGAMRWALQAWRPAGTSIAVALILLVGWGVINGRHGLSAWQQQRVKDQQLRKDIQALEQENARLREHVDRLKSDPNAIEHEAREQLHYAKQGEVIYTLPPQPAQSQNQAQPAGAGK